MGQGQHGRRSLPVENTELAQAVANWVRAEWEFRCSPRAYTAMTEEWYVKAQVRLRRCLVQRGELEDAYKELQNGKE